MAEVLFYHLTQSPLEATLPGLLQKSRARGWRALVRAGTEARLDWLDVALWKGDDAGFLAHGLAGGVHDCDQPILLACGPGNPNAANILFSVDGAAVENDEINAFTRVCILFDGNDTTALEVARRQWKTVSSAGFPALYWAQDDGRWVQKAAANTPA